MFYLLDVRWGMIVGVKSHSSNIDRRGLVRKTWGSVKLFNGVQLAVFFIVGLGENDTKNRKLAEEAKSQGDLLQIMKNETCRYEQ